MKKKSADTKKFTWNKQASLLIKKALLESNCTHEVLSKKLAEIGIDIKASIITQKLARGTFSTIFLLQCALALGIENISLSKVFEDFRNSL